MEKTAVGHSRTVPRGDVSPAYRRAYQETPCGQEQYKQQEKFFPDYTAKKPAAYRPAYKTENAAKNNSTDYVGYFTSIRMRYSKNKTYTAIVFRF
jgi:hypothetical protein